MTTVISKKEYLRKEALKIRDELASSGALDRISDEIVSKIISLDEFKNAKNIALYYPIKNEINLLSLLKQKDKNFYFPRCIGAKMEFAKYEKNSFSIGKFSIMEPTNKAVEVDILDMILIPTLACNTYCFRLGWGKGYYDRFISQNKSKLKAKKAIIVPFCNLTDEFVQDDFDEQSDMVITEKMIYKV